MLHFTELENISVFQDKLEEYFLVNKIPKDDKLVIIKCSLKSNAKVWFDTIGSTFFGPTLTYDTLLNKFKEAFPAVCNKIELRQELFTKWMTFHDRQSDFLLRKLDLNELQELNMSFAASPRTNLIVASEHKMEPARKNIVPMSYFTGLENMSDFQDK